MRTWVMKSIKLFEQECVAVEKIIDLCKTPAIYLMSNGLTPSNGELRRFKKSVRLKRRWDVNKTKQNNFEKYVKFKLLEKTVSKRFFGNEPLKRNHNQALGLQISKLDEPIKL